MADLVYKLDGDASGDTNVNLVREGAGRFIAYLAQPGQGWLRLGTVLGGRGSWTAEAIGGRVFRERTRASAAAAIGRWGLTQPGARKRA